MLNPHKPNFIWHLIFLLAIGVELWLMSRATFNANLAATAIGCFAGTLTLGLGRADNMSRFMNSGGRYIEWPAISADRALNVLFIAGWLLGMVNFVFVAKELSR